MSRKARLVLSLVAVFGFIVLGATAVNAFQRYNDGCNGCHGTFPSTTSPKGTTFVTNKHEMHRSSSEMNTECDLCHTTGDQRNPFIGSSNGTANNVGYGCTGCHGRLADAGNDLLSNGYGAGLRRHHDNAGVQDCRGCHTDADPANGYTPVDENVVPAYYGTVDTLADNPCNDDPTFQVNENWSVGDFIGLDNDGDLAYDTADVVCAPEPGETLLLLAGVGVLGLLARRRI